MGFAIACSLAGAASLAASALAAAATRTRPRPRPSRRRSTGRATEADETNQFGEGDVEAARTALEGVINRDIKDPAYHVDGFRDDPAVSADLIAQIDAIEEANREEGDPGLDFDPFICAQKIPTGVTFNEVGTAADRMTFVGVFEFGPQKEKVTYVRRPRPRAASGSSTRPSASTRRCRRASSRQVPLGFAADGRRASSIRRCSAVVRDCLGVSEGEEVLVVCNPATQGLGERMRAEAAEAGADAVARADRRARVARRRAAGAGRRGDGRRRRRPRPRPSSRSPTPPRASAPARPARGSRPCPASPRRCWRG